MVASDVKPGAETTDKFTSLRRTTRSTAQKESQPSSALNLSSYAYTPSTPRKRVKREPSPEVKEEPLNEVKEEEAVAARGKRPRSSTSTPNKGSKNGFPMAARAKPHAEPPKWREQYALIERMRAGIQAPVDTM